MRAAKLIVSASVLTVSIGWFHGNASEVTGENTQFERSSEEGSPLPSGSVTKEVKVYERRFSEEPDSCFLARELAYSYQTKGELDVAIDYFQKALRNCPVDPLLRFQFGVTYLMKGERSAAVKHMEEAVEVANKIGDAELQEFLISEREAFLSGTRNQQGEN